MMNKIFFLKKARAIAGNNLTQPSINNTATYVSQNHLPLSPIARAMAHCRYTSLSVLCSSLFVLGALSLTSGTQAATWVNPGQGNWFVGSNWDGGIVPGGGDGPSVSNGGTAILDGGNAAAYVFYIGKAAAESGTVIMNNGALNVGTEILVGEYGTGTFILNGGEVNATWEMKIADLAGSVGHVLVNGGKITTAPGNNFIVGRAGTGTLEMNNDGQFNSDWAFFGGEIWRNTLMAKGTGTVVLNDNSRFYSTSGIVWAAGADSVGQVTINDNSTMTTNGSLNIGYDGVGNLTINGGLVNSNGPGWIGTNAGSSGNVVVNNGKLTIGGNMYVGAEGTGVLTINGGEVKSGSALLMGYDANSSGSIIVDGGTMTTQSALYVGYEGNGTLTLNSGKINNGTVVWVGTYAGSVGTLNLNGGILATNQLSGYQGSAFVTFNGGTLQALSDNDVFIQRFGTIQVGAGGATIDSNGHNIGAASSFSGPDSATLVKTGAGALNINADNSGFLGQLRVDAGTLTLSQANTFANASSVQLNNSAIVDTLNTNQQFQQLAGSSGTTLLTGSSAITLNNVDGQESTFAGVITGNGALNKIGNGLVTLAGAGSTQGSINVQQGTLALAQSGLFTTTGDYTTQSGATSVIGAKDARLQVGGVFTQQNDSNLYAILGASPDITAQSAQLGGTLVVKGFADRDTPITASSAIRQGYIFLHTAAGITGDFIDNPLIPDGLDYLLHNGEVINGVDYELDFHLAWTQGGQRDGTGSFSLHEGTGFNVDIALDNQTVPDGGFSSGWDGHSLVKDGAGRLVLSKENGYTGSSTVNDGVLQLDIADSIKASSDVIINGGLVDLNGNNQQFNRLAGHGGAVDLNGASLTVLNASTADSSLYEGAITGNGTLIKAGAGSLTLSGNTSWVGNTELQAGSLILDGTSGGAQLTSNVIGQSGTQLSLINGASLTGWIDPTDVSIDSASQWNMTANSLVDNLTHGGTVVFVVPTTNDFKTLTVNGNYAGNNGLLVLNTQLGNDNSLSDKLVVTGDTSGSTRVKINNAGGRGAQTLEGIEVVSVGGESNGEFVQNGRIAAGAYDYSLGRGTAEGQTGNWYLTSQSAARPEAGAYNANLAAANTMFVTRLHDRLGETQYIDALTGEHKVTSLWLRNEGGHNRFRDESGQLRTQSNRYVLQLGGDIAQWSNNGADRFHLGLMAGYGDNKSNTLSGQSGYRAKGAVDGYSVGAYGTWYANAADKSGWYVDSWLQYSWFNNTVSGQELASETYKSKGMSASVESGYTFKLGESVANNLAYFIQPKAQLTWMGVKADDHREANGTQVKGEGDGNLQSRLGVKAFINGYSDQDKGKDRVFQPFVEANWVHNSKDFGSNLDGQSIKQDGAANIAELKLGVEGQLSKQVNLWGNVGQQVGNNGYSDTSVMLGAKYNF
ncbi:hypothetical protein C9426_21270 [Serratia sp. S1B]|nr:hypothetical protein C9426_21270 [Serratia sp. S1B]